MKLIQKIYFCFAIITLVQHHAVLAQSNKNDSLLKIVRDTNQDSSKCNALRYLFDGEQDPVKKLDVSLLADNLLQPVLGINDPRTDTRIDFIGGMRGLKELEKRVNSGEMAVAFALYATSMSDLMAVADSNQVMPPKSTWFEPKLADGLVSHVLD